MILLVVNNVENDDILGDEISDDEILNAVKKLKNGKSPGADGIPTEATKETCSILLPFYTRLLNEILNTGNFPDSWNLGLIVPLHKAGDREDPNNYRGIALLDIISKVFTSILDTRIKLWALRQDIISESQAGFREDYSTIDQIFVLDVIIHKYIRKKRGTFYCIFVDFKKAFDTVDRTKLLYILLNNGLLGKISTVLRSMYIHTKAAVRCTKDSMSEIFNPKTGVRQGCMLSPISFIMYIALRN